MNTIGRSNHLSGGSSKRYRLSLFERLGVFFCTFSYEHERGDHLVSGLRGSPVLGSSRTIPELGPVYPLDDSSRESDWNDPERMSSLDRAVRLAIAAKKIGGTASEV